MEHLNKSLKRANTKSKNVHALCSAGGHFAYCWCGKQNVAPKFRRTLLVQCQASLLQELLSPLWGKASNYCDSNIVRVVTRETVGSLRINKTWKGPRPTRTRWGTGLLVGALLPFHGMCNSLGALPTSVVGWQGCAVCAVTLHPDLPAQRFSLLWPTTPQNHWSRPCHIPFPW